MKGFSIVIVCTCVVLLALAVVGACMSRLDKVKPLEMVENDEEQGEPAEDSEVEK